MDNLIFESIEKVRQQFDTGPYPRDPLNKSPKDNYDFLYIHNFITPYYLRNQRVIGTEGKLILDAGCGTGYKALALAIANPGAKIVGIDISEESVNLAIKRLEHHRVDNAEFYAISIDKLSNLELEFDYINCDEVLYLVPDIVSGLRAMQSVLKSNGIIRANLHSYWQRYAFYRAQKMFAMMGFMDKNPGALEIEVVREIIISLKNEVDLKARTWDGNRGNKDEAWILSNYLLQGDRGYTIPEMFAALEASDLEFISMVKWRHWELMDLFRDPDNLPAFLGMSLPEISLPERLHLFELLQPIHRLLDFWCGHPQESLPFVPVSEWTQSDWQEARIHLHPNLRNPRVRQDLVNCITNRGSFRISNYITTPALGSISLDPTMAACLLPLWEGPKPVSALVERWLKVQPLHPATLDPLSEAGAWKEVTEFLKGLESFLYVLLERPA